ncbi:conserved hypothetical protein [Tenacibaculum sediminilitoris]|uniref:ligand-binding sensor domain-containing protein n=1 Tax=Tenacibaculum sediminilitoris TaxID=1820334 RepID=UPI0038962604
MQNSTTLIKVLFFTCLFIFGYKTGSAQKPIYKHYTVEEGLPHDITYQIIQDSNGYIWIGTDDGLAKFNGSSFERFTYENGLLSNYVIDIIEDKPNEYLIATWGAGVHKLKNDSIYPIKSENRKTTKVKKIHRVNDSILLADFNNGAFYFYNTKDQSKKLANILRDKTSKQVKLSFKKTTRKDTVIPMSQKKIDSTIYFFSEATNTTNITPTKGIYVLKKKNNLLEKINLHEVNKIQIHTVAKSNGYFFAASYNTIYVFNKAKKLIAKRQLNVNNSKITQLQVINQNLYFVAKNDIDSTRKLYKYNWDNLHLKNISKELSINSLISDFLFDNDKNLWITTYGEGIYFIPNKANTFYGKDFFKNPDLKDIEKLNEGLVLLSLNTIYEFNNSKIKSKYVSPFISEKLQVNNQKKEITLVSSVCKPSYDKLNNYKINYDISKSFEFKNDTVNIILHKNELNISGFNNKKISIQTTYDANIKNVLKYKNALIALYGKGGIFEINLNSKESIKEWSLINKKFASEFNDIVINKDTLWVATNKGVFKITPTQTKNYTTTQGLLSNHINDLYVDSHGILWIATQRGLNVYTKNTFCSIDKNLGQYSSFATKITEQNDFIYVTGNKGLFRISNANPFSPKQNTKLLVKQDKDSFYLNTINFINPETTKVAYKLNNNNWVETTSSFLNFNNNTQGKYQIKFRYKDNLSTWKETNFFKFKIIYPWHQQTWFYITITVLVLGGFIFLLFLGLQKSIHKNIQLKKNIAEKEKLQKALKEVRKNVARDFHDELGNKLASISITSNMLIDHNYTQETKNKEKKLKQIKKDADYLYHGMKDFVWSLDHKNDDLHQLQVYLNDFGENLFENSSITFYSTPNFSNKKIALPFYWSKQLVLIFKEAMTNVLKHSKASKVYLTFKLQNNLLKITLKDNGIGFKPDELNRLNGIKNMQHRTSSLHQQINIETNNGVTVTFTGNLKEEHHE